jgi:hypothetical protein
MGARSYQSGPFRNHFILARRNEGPAGRRSGRRA